jgi:hypothetical protein
VITAMWRHRMLVGGRQVLPPRLSDVSARVDAVRFS